MSARIYKGEGEMASKFYYSKSIRHDGLNKFKVIKAETSYELAEKVRATEAQWAEQWAKKCLAEQKKQDRLAKIKSAEDAVKYANERTTHAEAMQETLEHILVNSIGKYQLKFESLKNTKPFEQKMPVKPKEIPVPNPPLRNDAIYNPKMPLLVKLFKNKKEEYIAFHNNKYEADYIAWQNSKEHIALQNAETEKVYASTLKEWEERKAAYIEEQTLYNNEIDTFKEKYTRGDSNAIERYYPLSLELIDIPIEYERDFSVEYNAESKVLIVDALVPTIDTLPDLKKITYVKSREEFTETFYSESHMKKKYDSVLYQLVLTYLNHIFEADKEHDFIDSVVLNGIVNTTDKSTGQDISPCILSVTVTKQDFESINLNALDPKAWFKSSKGVSAASFATITPVVPIVSISREDKRFVEGYAVADTLDDSINLAAIDWQDFENLIREIFEKEFNTNGGEVKITQASRDGGVDAVAFDPDPIRGGKIVIQAKRYTNTVGVSAVRDLYGTVMNEGATKGILVTTSNYGSDAYSFANGKPLTLLNGGELLYLLEKHGHKARINLKEAKETLKKES